MPSAVVHVPAGTQPKSLTATFDDTVYRLRLFYVARTDSWYLHLELLDGTRLFSGRRLTPINSLADPSDTRQPRPGHFFAVDLSDVLQEITAESFANEAVLIYITPEDFAAGFP